MYQVIGIKRVLALFGMSCIGAFLIWAALAPPVDPMEWRAWWKIGSAAVGNVVLLVTIAGQTALFPFLCRLPGLRSRFPDIDGEWFAELESNWPIIQHQLGVEKVEVQPNLIRAKIAIRARLFFIYMNLESDDRYSTSKTIFVQAARDALDGSFQLNYIYQNQTLRPTDGDASVHHGAASLSFHNDPTQPWMQGVYWTDRNWTKGLNTAGRITLRRVHSDEANCA
jgi:hypothetical protein